MDEQAIWAQFDDARAREARDELHDLGMDHMAAYHRWVNEHDFWSCRSCDWPESPEAYHADCGQCAECCSCQKTG